MTSVNNVKGEIDIQRFSMDTEEFNYGNWTFSYTKSHILHSICTTPLKCKEVPQDQCLLCRFTNGLKLPHLPEMVFPKNILTIVHSTGGSIEINAFDALKLVGNGKTSIEVACADVWKETRNPQNLTEKIKPFDWTFTTDYKGNLSNTACVCSTDERINIEKLKEKEKILFYQELMLYEDELHDNGLSSFAVKIRVMPSSFYVLLRFFLRVDNVMVRINDTRFFHDFTKDYVLREYTNKECGIADIKLPYTVFGDPNILSPHMPLRTAIYEKITFRSVEALGTNN